MPHSDSDTSPLQSPGREEHEAYVNGDYVGRNPLAQADYDSSSSVDPVDLDDDHMAFVQSKVNGPRITSRTDSDWKEESTRAVTESFEEDSEDQIDYIVDSSRSSTATFTPRQSREICDPVEELHETPYIQEHTFRSHRSAPICPPVIQAPPPTANVSPSTNYSVPLSRHTPPALRVTPPAEVMSPREHTFGNRLESAASATPNRSTSMGPAGEAYVRNVTSKGTRIVSCEQLERPQDTVRYVEVPMVEHTTRTVPVRQVQHVERRVPKQETHYVTKEVEQLTIQFKEKFVEVEQLEVVEKRVPVVQIEERMFEVIREVPRIEIQQVEKIVEVPEIVEVPKPYKVVTENKFTRFHDEDTHVLVAQTVQPVVTLSQEETEVELVEYEAEPVPVDIHVPKLIAGGIKIEQKPTEMRVVPVPAAQYNSILSQLNTHLPQQHRETLPYQKDPAGAVSFLPERANYHHLTTPGQTPRCLDREEHKVAPRSADIRVRAQPRPAPAVRDLNSLRYEIPADSLSLTVKPRPRVVV